MSFTEPVKTEVGEALLGLQYENYFQGFITLLDILNKLSNSDYINLNDSNFEEINENQQLKRLFNFVKYNFKDEITLNQASEKYR